MQTHLKTNANSDLWHLSFIIVPGVFTWPFAFSQSLVGLKMGASRGFWSHPSWVGRKLTGRTYVYDQSRKVWGAAVGPAQNDFLTPLLVHFMSANGIIFSMGSERKVKVQRERERERERENNDLWFRQTKNFQHLCTYSVWAYLNCSANTNVNLVTVERTNATNLEMYNLVLNWGFTV